VNRLEAHARGEVRGNVRTSSLIQDARHIRIVLLTGLGDVVHGLPLANAIRRTRPDCFISWVVEPMPAGLLAPHPSIDRVIVFDKKRGLQGVRELWQKLRNDAADVTLNLNVYFKSIFPTLLKRSPIRIGFDRGRSHDGVWLSCNHHLEARARAHTQDMFLEFLTVLGVPAEPLEWRLQPTEEEQRDQAEFLASHAHTHVPQHRGIVALVTASANRKKDWVPERYVELAGRLHADFGLRPMLIGGPGAHENEIARMIVQRSRAPVIHALGNGVRRLIWLIQSSRLLIAPDTGPVHIARAMGVPVVGLFGHTNPWRVGPYRMYEDLWIDRYTEPDEAPDPSNATPKLGRMEQITTQDVLDKVEVALARYRSAVPSLTSGVVSSPSRSPGP
jgi:heptosyltransferase I